MRRNRWKLAGTLAVAWLYGSAASGQQEPINPYIPPPPPKIEEYPLPERIPEPILQLEPTLPPLPARVSIPSGTRIEVVLETPMSTRISQSGQVVRFRTAETLSVTGNLEIPPETTISGRVIEAKSPGRFGKAGKLLVKVDRIELAGGATAPVFARLESQDLNGNGQLSDGNRVADLYSLGVWTLQGTLLGRGIKGGKGAAVGAGAGAAIGLIIMASKRGPDIYLEPGMPFQVILDEPVELDGRAVYEAQIEYKGSQVSTGQGYGKAGATAAEREEESPANSDRPRLKRRPKK